MYWWGSKLAPGVGESGPLTRTTRHTAFRRSWCAIGPIVVKRDVEIEQYLLDGVDGVRFLARRAYATSMTSVCLSVCNVGGF